MEVTVTSYTGNPSLTAQMISYDSIGWQNLVITQWAPSGTWESLLNFGANEGHAYMECSNKGLCDRAIGECVCFPGYEGSACQRTVCPNKCSGHGICRNINDRTQSLAFPAAEPYPLWDGLKNQACICDPGFGGIDCSLRLCPRNADPLIDGVVYETQKLTIAALIKTFVLQYNDTFGETWTTSIIETSGTLSTMQTNIANALTGIPNGVIQAVTVTCTGSSPIVCTILFSGSAGSILTGNAGDLNQLVVSSIGNSVLPSLPSAPDTITASANVYTYALSGNSIIVQTSIQGSNAAEECSYRGLCNYETGICKCFRGYRTDDCHLQHALAF